MKWITPLALSVSLSACFAEPVETDSLRVLDLDNSCLLGEPEIYAPDLTAGGGGFRGGTCLLLATMQGDGTLKYISSDCTNALLLRSAQRTIARLQVSLQSECAYIGREVEIYISWAAIKP